MCLSNGTEVGRSHSRSFGIVGATKHAPYLEFDDDTAISKDLDELIVTFVYVQIRREKDERTATNASAASAASAAAAASAAS